MPPGVSWFAEPGEASRIATKAQKHSGKDAKTPQARKHGLRSTIGRVFARLDCKAIIFIGIQTHRKLDNDTLNVYYG